MITVYKTQSCPRCRLLMQWLDDHSIPFQTKSLESPEVITDLRLEGCFQMEAPILQIGETYYSAGWLFAGAMLETGKIAEALP